MPPSTGRWWQRPSLHFLVFGTVLFGLWSLREPEPPAEQVVVTPEVRERLANDFRRQRGREPTSVELDRVAWDWALEEAQVREAVALGLANDDPVIRRRLVQKLGFLYEDLGAVEPLDDGALEAYRDEHAWRYAVDASLDLEHVFLGEQATREDAKQAAADAEAGREPAGSACAWSREQTGKRRESVAAQFGPGFAAAVFEDTEQDTWFAAESTVGWHLVRITDRDPGHMPELATIRARVEHDANQDAREHARQQAQRTLAHRYGVQR